jgi:peptide/nickel transport system permease protein
VSVLRLVANRVVSSVVSLFGASLFSFIILRLTPGDPARLFLGPFATEAAVAQLRAKLGVDDPIPLQYLTYIGDFLHGDWGFSYTTGEPVVRELMERLPATLELGFCAFVFAVFGAVILALGAVHHYGKAEDKAALAVSFFGLGVPTFWFGLMLLVLFFERLGWLPGPDGRLSLNVAPPSVTGLYTVDALLSGQWAKFLDAARHLILPAITLGMAPLGFLMRLLRANLLDIVREPFILVVRSHGASRWGALVRHALPNACLPALTATGLIFGQLLAGSLLVERVFNWPGAGALVADGVLRQDFSVAQAFILLSAVMYVLAMLVVDLLAGLIDPRIRHPVTLE